MTVKRDQTPQEGIVKHCPGLDAFNSHDDVLAVSARWHVALHELTSKSETLWVKQLHESTENHAQISLGLWCIPQYTEANHYCVIMGVFADGVRADG